MYALYTMLAVFLFLGGVVSLVVGSGEKYFKKSAVVSAVLFGMIFLVVFVPRAPQSSMKTEHSVILTDTFESVKYDRVMKIDYDQNIWPWWSWQSANNGTIVNRKVSVYEGAK